MDFTGQNIDMTCFLLEQCGRFLYLQPQSHARMNHLVIYNLIIFHALINILNIFWQSFDIDIV